MAIFTLSTLWFIIYFSIPFTFWLSHCIIYTCGHFKCKLVKRQENLMTSDIVEGTVRPYKISFLLFMDKTIKSCYSLDNYSVVLSCGGVCFVKQCGIHLVVR